MKYQKLQNLESGWIWHYLINKYKSGEKITRYLNESEAEAIVQQLIAFRQEPVKVMEWIQQHIDPGLENRLKQAIRAKRKRYFNAEQLHTRKKSIDLEFLVWQKLSQLASVRSETLSETIMYLINKKAE